MRLSPTQGWSYPSAWAALCNDPMVTAFQPQLGALWSTFGATFERLEQDAPEGYAPRVQVTLNDGEQFEPGTVQEIGPWVFFEVDDPGDVVTERRRVIAVPPETLIRIEIKFVRTDGRSLGFHVEPPESLPLQPEQ
jgi:hypothetical protein